MVTPCLIMMHRDPPYYCIILYESINCSAIFGISYLELSNQIMSKNRMITSLIDVCMCVPYSEAPTYHMYLFVYSSILTKDALLQVIT